MTRTIEEKRRILEGMVNALANDESIKGNMTPEAWKAEMAAVADGDDITRLIGSTPEETFAALLGYFYIQAIAHAAKNDIDRGLKYLDKIHHLTNGVHEIINKNKAQVAGGKKRHQKTREIKGFIMKEWAARQSIAKPKRAIARDMLPMVLELANNVGHRFPDNLAALAFIEKSLPKKGKKDA